MVSTACLKTFTSCARYGGEDIRESNQLEMNLIVLHRDVHKDRRLPRNTHTHAHTLISVV